MPSLLDPLPDEGQQLVEIVAKAYGWTGTWPVWQYVAQQARGKHGIDAEAALRNLPEWRWGNGIGYQAIRTVPGIAGNSSPDVEARAVLTIHGLLHATDGANHPLVRAFLKAIEIGANQQDSVTLSPTEVKPITVTSEDLVGVVNHLSFSNFTPSSLGLILSAEPATSGGGIGERDEWTWDLTRHRPLRPFVADARGYLVALDALLDSQSAHPYTAVSPDALPRALDHLNVVWKVATSGDRLFYPRGLAAAASLTEPVTSGDQLTARLGVLADVFDLFLRTPTGRPPAGGTLNAFRDQVVGRLDADTAKEQAKSAVGQLIDINRIRNGRLHTDTTNWVESLNRLGVPTSEPPGEQWERIRAITVEAVYTLIELLQQLIL